MSCAHVTNVTDGTDEIVVAGGQGLLATLNTVEIFNLASLKWRAAGKKCLLRVRCKFYKIFAF
jgi:hypothetical protein